MDSFELPTGEIYIPHNDEPPQPVADNKPADNDKPAPEEPKGKPRRKPKSAPEENDDEIPRPTLSKLFVEERLRMFIGTVLILISCYMFAAIISYIFSNQEDQSVVANHTMYEISHSPSTVNNAGGKVGAFFANFFISNWLGISSIILLIYMLVVGYAVVANRRINYWRITFKALVSTIALSIILGGITYCNVSPTFWGGRHGAYVTEFFMDNTSVWGTLCIDLILASAIIFMFFGTVSKGVKKVTTSAGNYQHKLSERYNQSMHSDNSRKKAETEAAPAEVNTSTAQADNTSTPQAETINTETTVKVEADINPPETALIELADISEAVTTTYEEQPDNGFTKTEGEIDTMGFDVKPYKPADNENDTTERPTTNSEMIVVSQNPIEKADVIDNNAYDPTAELSRYRFPSIDLLHERTNSGTIIDQEEQEENKQVIINALRSYGVEISSIKATVGPTITLYEIVPAEGVRIAKIKRLGDDMTLSLAAIGIRIIAPIPGKGTIGMEVPNKKPQTVGIRSILSSKAYQESKAELPMAMGSTITNDVYIADLTKMPHLLVAGATGMGKSVGLNTIIASLLYKKHPAELKFVLVDPKMVEFSLYKCLERHFLAKLPDEEDAIITDPMKVVATLNSLCIEMDNRYALLSQAGMRGIKEYNQKFISRQLNPQKGHRFLPYIVVIIDEFADLITTAGKDVETPISRIAAKARAVGIHMILATQRPSVNVITGVIKANFPGRMAFRVTQNNDSRTILDRPGAEQLIGRGDMLISRDGMIDRVQCAFIDTDEVQAMCNSISEQMGYPSAYELPEYSANGDGSGGTTGNAIADRDPLFADAGRAIIESGTGSTSYLQRKYNIGYPRAGKIMDQLEAAGVVGAALGGKPRSVIMDMYSFERYLESF